MNNISVQNHMPQAISYVRFSSDRQSKGSSSDRQEEMILDWLSNNPSYELSKLSAKDLGRSGYKGEHLRYGLGGILSAIESGKIGRGDVLLVEAIDRLGRLAPMEMVQLIRDIVRAGVAIITLQDQQRYDESRLNSDAGALFILVGKVQQAFQFSVSLGDRISKAYARKRKNARNGEKIRIPTPFWLNTDGTLKSEESKAVRECIDLYLKGRGPRKVLTELEGKYPQLREVHPSTLKRWFMNRALIGEWDNKGDPIRGVFDPLIDEAMYYDLQKELRHKSKNMSPEQTYSLSGLVVCKKCGGRFLYRRKVHKDFIIIYANCATYLKRGQTHCANNKTWPYQVLEYIFKETYHTVLANILARRASEHGSKELTVLMNKRDEISANIVKVTDAMLKVPDVTELIDKLDELSKARRDIDLSIFRIEEAVKNEAPTLTLGDDSGGQQLHDLINSDVVVLRELLKRNGYQILIDGSSAFVLHEEDVARKQVEEFLYMPNLIEKRVQSKYELVRRSTRHNCYIVKRDVKWVDDAISVTPDNISMIYEYAAIFRDGEVLYETHEELLIKLLESRRTVNQNDAPAH